MSISQSEIERCQELFFATVEENLNKRELRNVLFPAITDHTKAAFYGDYETFTGGDLKTTEQAVKNLAIKFAGFYNAIIQYARGEKTGEAVKVTHWREVKFRVHRLGTNCIDPLAVMESWAVWSIRLEAHV